MTFRLPIKMTNQKSKTRINYAKYTNFVSRDSLAINGISEERANMIRDRERERERERKLTFLTRA